MSEESGDSDPPVTLKARRLACENSKWEVFLDHIEGAMGNSVRDYLVIRPKTRARRNVTGVTVLPVIRDRVLLLHTYRYAMGGFFWEAARGFIDPGERPESAALRELEEETGHRCEAGDLISLGTAVQEPSTLIARVSLFAALDCRPAQAAVDDELGLGALRSFALDDAMEMVRTSEIEDATTIIALYRLREFLTRDG